MTANCTVITSLDRLYAAMKLDIGAYVLVNLTSCSAWIKWLVWDHNAFLYILL